MMNPPRIGIGVFVARADGKREYVIGKRKGSHGAGTYALPGGHLEHGETFEQCAAREVLEETGLVVHNLRFLTATNSVFAPTASGKHYVTIFMTATVVTADAEGAVVEPQNREPDKCEGWSWRSFGQIRDLARDGNAVLFQPLLDLMEQRPEICSAL